jgi:hypothetical protein
MNFFKKKKKVKHIIVLIEAFNGKKKILASTDVNRISK